MRNDTSVLFYIARYASIFALFFCLPLQGNAADYGAVVNLMSEQIYVAPNNSNVTVTNKDGVIQFAVLQPTSNSVQVGFDNIQRTVDFDTYPYFYFESRGDANIRFSRIRFYDGSNNMLTYETDVISEPTITKVTLRGSNISGSSGFGPIKKVEFVTWMPDNDEAGLAYTLGIRNAEFRTAAADQTPDYGAMTIFTPPTPVNKAIPFAERQWNHLGPGGGGAFLAVDFSPHNDNLLIGSDVAGIFHSTDYLNFNLYNDDLMNTYVQTIVHHPTDPNIVFMGTFGGGVAKSTDGGVTWDMKRTGFRAMQTFGHSAPVYVITIDPVDPQIMYAGLGFSIKFGAPRYLSVLGYIYKSIDTGETWQEIAFDPVAPPNESVRAIVLDPVDPATVYVLAQSKLYVYTQASGVWTEVTGLPLAAPVFTGFEIKRDDPNVMLLSYANYEYTPGSFKSGLFRSTDAGQTWVERVLPTSITNSSKGAHRILRHPTQNNTFYLIYKGSIGGVYRSTDGGDTWAVFNDSLSKDPDIWVDWSTEVLDFAIDANDPNRMCYVNLMEAYLTTDGGLNWQQITTQEVTPAIATAQATYRANGLDDLVVYDLLVDTSDTANIYLGYLDTALWKTTNGGQTVSRRTAGGMRLGWGDINAMALDPVYPNIVYVAKGQGAGTEAIYRSLDSGESFELLGIEETGFPAAAIRSGGLVSSIAIDPFSPTNSRTIYVGLYNSSTDSGVHKSTDGGLSWTSLDLTTLGGGHVTGIALDPQTVDTLYISSRNFNGNRGYVAKSTDGGATWVKQLTNVDMRSIVVDPFDPMIIYAGNRDYSGTALDKPFWKSIDGGANWTFKTGTGNFLHGIIQQYPGDQGYRFFLSSLAVDPAVPGRIYAGLTSEYYDYNFGGGLFYSDDRGENWFLFDATGMPKYQINKIVVDPVNTSRLYIATGGNGVWRYGTDPLELDTDDDGMTDSWETANGLNPLIDDAGQDLDGDTLNNLNEYLYGTLANVSDTDNDGYRDGTEVALNSDPLDILSIPTIVADGDINLDGSANVGDLLLAQRHLLGLTNLTAEQIAHGDFQPASGDGEIKLGDYVLHVQNIL